jgi:hypothetical protein
MVGIREKRIAEYSRPGDKSMRPYDARRRRDSVLERQGIQK